VAIGTEGQAPALARKLKADLEVQLSPQTGRFVALLGRLRSAVTEAFPVRQRRDFWRWAATGPAYLAHMAGREREAASVLKQAIADRAAPEAEGHIALVGAGPGAKDLLTLRAMRPLEEADVIFYDRLVDPEIVALGAPEAERIYVGKAVGANAWPQDKIDRLIVAEACKGRRVVRLKSGDPSIFGRAGEEIDAARAAGISIEIVPGITAASAAAASLLRPLTERGETDTFAISTGRAKPGDADPERGRLAVPGTSMAFYMAVEKAGHVRADLMAAGAPAACPVDIVSHASTVRERHVMTTLGALEQTIRDEAVQSPAIVFVRYPKSLAAQQAAPLRA
jgi:uroporphyrin-III C-methyltransferase/precorrin-2 dehydrogenase/sirohydrochlorin ferrochelatase